MFKSKHSGWTWDLKRTPFGGGGGFISDIGHALASIDPGPAIGSGLASVDKAVNQIPGGWITVGGLAAGGLALAYAPEVMAFAEANGLTPAAASTELGIAPVNAATGEVVAPDVFAGLSANAPVDTSLSQAAAASMGGAGSADIGLGTNAALQGPTYQELGYTGLGEGMAGPTYAELGYTGLNNAEAIAAADAAAKSNLISDALGNVKDANKMANLLKQGAASGLSTSLGKLAQGSNPIGQIAPAILKGSTPGLVQSDYFQVSNKKPDLSALAELLKQG